MMPRFAAKYCAVFQIFVCLLGVQSVTFTEEPSNAFVPVNKTTILTCKVDGLMDNQTLLWKKDNVTISIDEFVASPVGENAFFTISMNRTKGEYNIQFPIVRVEDSSVYRCGVQKDDGEYIWSKEATLTVLKYINLQPSNAGYYEGKSVLLQCGSIIKGSYQTLRWSKDSKIFAFNNTVVDINNFPGRVRFMGDYTQGDYNITISNVTVEDTGVYRCGVDTESGDIEWSRPAWLTVLENVTVEPTVDYVLENETYELTCAVRDLQPDQIMVWKKDNTIISYNEFLLYHDNSPYHEGNRVIVELNMTSNDYYIRFNVVTSADSGLYRYGVQFPNYVYYWFTAIQLIVLDKPVTEISSTTTAITLSSAVETSSRPPVSTTPTRSPQESSKASALTTPNIITTTTMAPSGHQTSSVSSKVTTKVKTSTMSNAIPDTSSSDYVPTTSSPEQSAGSTILTTTRNQPAIPDRNKTSATSTELWVIIVAVVIGILALIAFTIIFVMVLMTAQRKRKQKNTDEYSPQEENLENLHMRLKAAGYENPYFAADAEEMGESSVQDDVTAASWQVDESGEDATKTDTEIDDLYAQPEKNRKTSEQKSDDADHNHTDIVKYNVEDEENIESMTPPLPTKSDDIHMDVMETDHVVSQDDAQSCEDNTVISVEDDNILLNETQELTTFS